MCVLSSKTADDINHKPNDRLPCGKFPPEPWLPSQPYNITIPRPIPNYTASWHTNISV